MAQDLSETPREVAERAAERARPGVQPVRGPRRRRVRGGAGRGAPGRRRRNPAGARAGRACSWPPTWPEIPLVAAAPWFGPGGRAAGRGGPQGPAVRRPGVEREPAVLRRAAELPGGLSRARATWSARAGLDDGRGAQGGDGHGAACSTRWRRRTSCRPTRPRSSGRSTPAGAAWSRARATSSTTCVNNEGRPRQVDTSAVRGGPQPGRHAGQGGVPQRPDGAAPVRAADRAGARARRCCAARRGSTSTT